MAEQYHRNVHMNSVQTTASTSSSSTSLTSSTQASSASLSSTASSLSNQNSQKSKSHHQNLNNEIQNLIRDNNKLSSIARLCIHMVDRCRMLNKSKQFIEDLSKLSNLIEDFNRFNTRKNSHLPTFNSTGLVFPIKQNQGSFVVVGKSGTSSNNNENHYFSSMNNTRVTQQISNDGNMYIIPILDSNQSSVQQLQFFHNNDGATNLVPIQTMSKTKGGKKKSSGISSASSLMMINSVVHQQQNQPQSILFRKLTESGQIILTQQPTFSGEECGNETLSNSIPINSNTNLDAIESNTALFTVVQPQNNYINQSNIENINLSGEKNILIPIIYS